MLWANISRVESNAAEQATYFSPIQLVWEFAQLWHAITSLSCSPRKTSNYAESTSIHFSTASIAFSSSAVTLGWHFFPMTDLRKQQTNFPRALKISDSRSALKLASWLAVLLAVVSRGLQSVPVTKWKAADAAATAVECKVHHSSWLLSLRWNAMHRASSLFFCPPAIFIAGLQYNFQCIY